MEVDVCVHAYKVGQLIPGRAFAGNRAKVFIMKHMMLYIKPSLK